MEISSDEEDTRKRAILGESDSEDSLDSDTRKQRQKKADNLKANNADNILDAAMAPQPQPVNQKVRTGASSHQSNWLDSLAAIFDVTKYPCCVPFADNSSDVVNANGNTRVKEGLNLAAFTGQGIAGADDSDSDASAEADQKSKEPPKMAALVLWKTDVNRVSADLVLSWPQKAYALLECCRAIETGNRLDELTVAQALEHASQQPKEIDVDEAMKQPKFQMLAVERRIEARLLAEALAETLSFSSEEEDGKVRGETGYCIVIRGRSVMVAARKKGEVMDLTLVDPSASVGRGPAILGFRREAELTEYIQLLFENDTQSKAKKGEKFRCYQLRSPYGYNKTRGSAAMQAAAKATRRVSRNSDETSSDGRPAHSVGGGATERTEKDGGTGGKPKNAKSRAQEAREAAMAVRDTTKDPTGGKLFSSTAAGLKAGSKGHITRQVLAFTDAERDEEMD